eukprot:TRINITY_DN30170_c0_g1_i1.p1 TRINITY_DN30170_c0_g1~~TRINITY_DN30170_c0_g1_i1.p1  ORF type:complete len:900 (+),score=245.48 TRINITY_DN30170_c0_g1_i1:89-2701(+)
MDLLKTQFSQHDARGAGTVGRQQFVKSLEKFGIKGDSLRPVVQKFSTRSGDVNYAAFLKHFGSAHGHRVSTYKEACASAPTRGGEATRTHDLPSYMQGKHVDGLIDRPTDLRGARSRTGRARENLHVAWEGDGSETYTATVETAETLGSPAARALPHQEVLKVTKHDTLCPTAPPRLLYQNERREPADGAAPLPSFMKQQQPGEGKAAAISPMTVATPPSVAPQHGGAGGAGMTTAGASEKVVLQKRGGAAHKAVEQPGSLKGATDVRPQALSSPVAARDEARERRRAGDDSPPPPPAAAPLPNVGRQGHARAQEDRDDAPPPHAPGPAPSAGGVSWRDDPNAGLEVRTTHGVLDVYRSDSASLAAFANGFVMGDKVTSDIGAKSWTGCRRRGSPVTRAHEASLPVSSISCLNGECPYDPSYDPQVQPAKPRRKARASTPAAATPRGSDIITGLCMDGGVKQDTPRRWDGEFPVEGRRYIQAPTAPSPRGGGATSGLRTYEGEERPFMHSKERVRSATPTGRRHLSQYPWYPTHFPQGVNGCPEDAPLLWPEGVPSNPNRNYSVSHIPGFSSTVQTTTPERVRRKAKAQEPSSFGYRPVERDHHSPLPRHRAGSPKPAATLRQEVAGKVVLNHSTVTKAWMELTKDVRCESPVRSATRVPVDKFASALRSKYGVDVRGSELASAAAADSIGLNDFNKLCGSKQGESLLLDKERDRCLKSTGRRYLSHDNPNRDRAHPPFATHGHSGDAADLQRRSATPRSRTVTLREDADQRVRSRSAGPPGRIESHLVHSIKPSSTHYNTSYANAYSPMRSRPAVGGATAGSPSVRVVSAGLPSRLREESHAAASIRCNSPDFRNKSHAMSNLLAHCSP